MKKVLLFVLLMFFLNNVKTYSQPWGHRYSEVQSDQNITANPDDSFKVSVEWGEGDWESSSFGYCISSSNVTNWTWIDLPHFQDGEGSNKRCSTNVSINIPGEYYYAYRMIKNAQTSYSFGSDEWSQNSTTLSATSTITINGKYSVSGGDWSNNEIWNESTLPSDNSIVGIHNGVILNQDATVADIGISNGVTFTASDGSKADRTLTIADGGTLTNDGTFNAADGKVVFDGAGTVTGEVTFNNIEIRGGVNFGASSSLDGTLTVNGGFASTNSITYNSSSTLKYSTTYTINSGDILWFPNMSSNGSAQNGVPWNVEIDGIEVKLNDNYPFYMNGSFVNNGTFRLGTGSDLNFGDLYLRGNFTDNGTFNANSRTTFFNGASLQTIGGTSNTTFAYLNIGSNAEVEVDSEKNITASNDIYIDGAASLTLKSDIDGTASLFTDGTVSGNVTIERYVDEASKAPTWHYVSSPVSGQSITSTWMTDNSVVFNDPAWHCYRWDEDTKYWIYYDYVGSQPEDFGDDEFVEGRGYSISRSEAGDLSFTGTVRTSDVTYPASYTPNAGAGWNLVGNPFTSPIGVTSAAESDGKFLGDNSSVIDPSYTALYIWDEQSNYLYGENDYKVISNSGIDNYTEIEKEYVESGQAFMVKVSSSGDLKFNKDMQYHADVDFYKSKEYWPSVELVVQGQGVANTTAIGFHVEMTAGLDPSYDVGKLKGNPDIALYTRLVEDNGVDFAIQALPIDDLETYEIPVGLDISAPGVYEFSANRTNFDHYNIVLEDREENTFTNLRWDTYFAQVDEGGLGRFYLHFKEATGVTETVAVNKPLLHLQNHLLRIINLDQGDYRIRITDITGRVVMVEDFTAGQSVNVPVSLKTGIYIVEIASENHIYTNKLYVQ